MLQTKLSISAHMAPPPTLPALGAHLHIERVNDDWEQALESYPSCFAHIRSVSLAQPLNEDQILRLRGRLAVPRPLARARQVSGAQPHALLTGLRVGENVRALAGAHLASPSALPRTQEADRPRSDVQQLFTHHPQLRAASVCRSLISADRIHGQIDREVMLENEKRLRRNEPPFLLDDVKRREQVCQALCIDIARSLFCVAKDLEQVVAPSLIQFMVLFDITGVVGLEDTLRKALGIGCGIDDDSSPWLGDFLQRVRPMGAPDRPIEWNIGYGTPNCLDWGVYRIGGKTDESWALTPVSAWTFLPRPFFWSTLSISTPPPGLT